MIIRPHYRLDFYKTGHPYQYAKGITKIWSNWTPRSTRIEGQKDVTFFGLQYWIKEHLGQWNEHFFKRPKGEVMREWKEFMKATLGTIPETTHLEKLHDLGYLPLDIYALPEGTATPLGMPMFVITNTVDHAYWMPNNFETDLSSIVWMPCTSATTARRFRKIFKYWAEQAGEQDFSFIDWQGHDFSMRGLEGDEAIMLSGMGHLLSFNGTDTVPAIWAAHDYYDADLNIGGSVPATEHSVMSAGSKEGEFETFKRLITEIYPTGIVSIVSDTWDLWNVLTNYIPRLKETILARDGKIVIRPDSGDPVKIICGDYNYAYMNGKDFHDYDSFRHPAYYGTLELLKQKLGVTDRGYGLPLINNGGAIYGDSIDENRANEILKRIVQELKLSPYNMVFGIGSYTYQYKTRDTYGFAMKATAVEQNGKLYNIFKDPITDTGGKKSHLGIPCVYEGKNGLYCLDQQEPQWLDNCAFKKVYSNGELLVDYSFDEIRKRVKS